MRMIAFICLALVCFASHAAAATTADADTVGVPAPDEAWRLRGVTEPLVAHPSGGQSFLRTLGYVPYGLVEVVGRPLYWLVKLDEERHIARRVSRLVVWDVKPVDTTVSALFGYETGLGLTSVGLRAKSRDWLGTGVDYDITAGYLNPRKNILSLRLHGREERLWLSLLNRLERKEERHFNGLGPGSLEEHCEADRRIVHNEIALNLRPADSWLVTTSIYRLHTFLDEPENPEDHEPSVRTLYPVQYETAAISRYQGVELALSRDTRNDGDFSTSGSYVQLKGGANFSSSAPDVDYRHYSAEARIFRRIWRGERALALRLYAEGLDGARRDDIPYTEMPSLGGRYTLRGFDSERFRDLRAALATLEYHYPISPWIQGRVFGDWGMVAPGWSDIRPGDLEFSGGMALALRYQDNALTIQYALSEEGGHVYVGTSSVFGLKPRRER
jgi:hypothetical protein